jgi:hypothetical protein
MGSASDALEDLTGVKVKAAPTSSPAYNNVAPTDTNPAASALRDLLGDKIVAPAPATFAERFQPAADSPLEKHDAPEAADHGLSERQKLSSVGKALSPITSYPETYQRMNKEAREQISSGVDQMLNPKESLIDPKAHGMSEVLTGAGKAALGTVGYVASPINAAYRSVVGQPVEDVTGIPREHTEFAAQLATPGLGLANVGKASAIKGAASEPRSIAELKAFASKGYEHPDLVGLEVKPEVLQNFALKSELELSKNGLNDTTAPKVVKALRDAQDVPGDAKVVTGQNIVSLRRTLGEIAGDGGSEAKAAKTAIDHLDEWMPNIKSDHVVNGDPAAAFGRLEQANADYSAAAHAELVDQKLLRAELRSASAHSGMGVTNQVRGRMADILINKKEQRGFTPEELAQMHKIVYGTTTQNMVRGAGNMLGGGGGVGSSILGMMTMGLTPGLGMALRYVGNRMTINQAQKLSEMIRSRPGLSSSVDKFEESAAAIGEGKTPKTMAGMALAARNLSNNLQSAGFNISPAELMRGLSGPSVGRAENGNEAPRGE